MYAKEELKRKGKKKKAKCTLYLGYLIEEKQKIGFASNKANLVG